jgi:PST family polysaccharide transporter/lipopolysaccharide exporter
MLVARGVILASILAATAPWIGLFFEEPRLVSMLTALSSVFIITSLTNVNTIAHQRNLDFRRLTFLNQLSAAVSLIVTTILAYWMRSVWALVVGQIIAVSIYSVLSYHFVGGRMRFGFDSIVARDLLRYGKFITGSSIVVYVASELDSAAIGKILGTEMLGYYALALTIANLATANLSKVASAIMMPAYSRLQSDQAALRRAYLGSLELVLAITMPATGGLLLLAGPIIGVLYGNDWLVATEPLQILAVFGLLRAMASFSGYLFEGLGRPKVAFQLGMLRLVIIVPLIVPMAQRFGLAGVAVAVTVSMAVQWLAGLILLRRLVGIPSGLLALTLWRPAWKTIVMAIAVHACTLCMDPTAIAGLLLSIVVGVVVYGVLSLPGLVALLRDRSS